MGRTAENNVGGARLVRLYSLGGGWTSQGTAISIHNERQDFAHGTRDERYFTNHEEIKGK